MAMFTSEIRPLGAAEQNVARILIAFYFMAVALGFAEGVSFVPVFEHLLPAETARHASDATLFGLGYLVLLGGKLRAVALVMAFMLVATYVLTAVKSGVWDMPRTIWRDVALIGALVLTYAQRDRGLSRQMAVVRKVPKSRKAIGRPQRVLSKSDEMDMLAQVPAYVAQHPNIRHKRPTSLEDVFRQPSTT